MANDDIKDLIGRYATGSLTADEQKRLFDAALDDQDVFNEIAQEQDVKQLLAEPGARERLIHALEPPRKTAWIFGVAATAALTVLIAVVLLRPAPKPPQVAAVKPAPQAAQLAPSPEAASSTPTPLADKPQSAPEPVKQKAQKAAPAAPADEPARDASKDAQPVEKTEKKADNKVAENRAEDRKELDQVAGTPPKVAPAPLVSPAPLTSPAPATPTPAPPPPAARSASESSARVGEAMHSPVQQLQRKASGPRQQQAQQTTQQKSAVAGGSVSTLAALPPFGFHYSVETKGHLVLIPAADGYLTVKSNDGSTLFSRKRVATGIIIDVAVPDGATSVSISFAASALLQSTPTPAVRTEPEGTVEGPSRVAVEIKIQP